LKRKKSLLNIFDSFTIQFRNRFECNLN